MTKILNLMCTNGPGRCADAQRCLERDLGPCESIFMSKIMIMIFLLGLKLNRGPLLWLIVGHEVYTCWVCLVEKSLYFVHIDQNRMDSNPNGATSWWDSLIKTVRIVINPFLEPKMRSTLELSASGVMVSTHRDSIWTTLPPRTLTFRF